MRQHRYEVSVSWTGKRGSGTSGYRDYGRGHELSADGRPVIAASSGPASRGDPACWNPELELTAAVSQRPMPMPWYLHLCADAGVVSASSLNFPVRHGPVVAAR